MNGQNESYDLSELTVLIVDKQAPMRTLLRNVLREIGVGRIVDANAPEKAWEEFNHAAPDLVMVDWCPDFDGVGLVKRIRTDNDSCFPQVPVIMVTAYGETRRIYQALDAGINEYLVKPVSASMLYSRVVGTIQNPRPFVRAESYTGPCRRRRQMPFAVKDRRRTDAKRGAGTDAAAVASTPNDPEPEAPANDIPARADAA